MDRIANAWLPIATAPKSSNNYVAIPILAFCPGEFSGEYGSDDRVRVIWWEPGLKRWRDDRDIDGSPKSPTHWMPLPDPPAPDPTPDEVAAYKHDPAF